VGETLSVAKCHGLIEAPLLQGKRMAGPVPLSVAKCHGLIEAR